MDYSLEELKMLDEETRFLFNEHDICATNDLVEAGNTEEGRKKLADRLGIKKAKIDIMVFRADLLRVPGIMGDAAELLQRAGVCGAHDLATRDPRKLVLELIELNEKEKVTRDTPTEEELREYIEDAKQLEEIIQS